MLRVIDCISEQHEFRLVAAAALLCVFATYTAMNLQRRAIATSGALRIKWLFAAAIAVGCGIWATHFVAMLAYRQDFQAGYAILPTLASVAIAMFIPGTGLALAAYRPRLAAESGILVGAGIGAMHFLGMSALLLPATTRYDLEYVFAAFGIGMALSAAALTIFRSSASLPRTALAAFTLACAICGLHFTAMASATIEPDPFVLVSGTALNNDVLAVAIIGASALMLFMGLVGSVFDRRLAARAEREAERLRQYTVELERTKSELQKTTASMKRARDEAEAGLQAKSQFLAAMSHELRTPLNAVIGFSEMLAKTAANPTRQATYVEYIRSSGVHLLKLVNDILDYSKASDGSLRLENSLLDPAEEVDAALAALAQMAEKGGVGLESTVPSKTYGLRADRVRLQQILLNIISNGIKFTPKGGRVSVSVLSEKSNILIRVKDTGIGIAKGDIANAFESFRQIDSRLARRFEGAGLGLPLSKELVELHGGSITIDSELGRGTTVTLAFPDREEPDQSPEKALATGSAA